MKVKSDVRAICRLYIKAIFVSYKNLYKKFPKSHLAKPIMYRYRFLKKRHNLKLEADWVLKRALKNAKILIPNIR